MSSLKLTEIAVLKGDAHLGLLVLPSVTSIQAGRFCFNLLSFWESDEPVELHDNDDDAIVTPAPLTILGKLTGHQATECLKPQLVAGMGWQERGQCKTKQTAST